MPRSSGIGRTGNKHKKVKFKSADDDEAKQERRLAALQAAAAAAETSASVAAGNDAAVREWLESVLKKVELAADSDELQRELERRQHGIFIGLGIACVEAWSLGRQVNTGGVLLIKAALQVFLYLRAEAFVLMAFVA